MGLQVLSETLNVIYIYAFSRRFYPKRLTVHSGYTFIVSTCVPWESNPQPFALLTQCSTTEPLEHTEHHTEQFVNVQYFPIVVFVEQLIV